MFKSLLSPAFWLLCPHRVVRFECRVALWPIGTMFFGAGGRHPNAQLAQEGGPHRPGLAAQDEQIGQRIDHVERIELAFDVDDERLLRDLIDEMQRRKNRPSRVQSSRCATHRDRTAANETRLVPNSTFWPLLHFDRISAVGNKQIKRSFETTFSGAAPTRRQ